VPLAIGAVRDFLANQRPDQIYPSGTMIAKRYELFRRELKTAARSANLSAAELTFSELRSFIIAFLDENPW
jgi:hypothetical protein